MQMTPGKQFTIRDAEDPDWPEISSISADVSTEGMIGDYINEIGKSYMGIGKTYVAQAGRIIAFQHVQDVNDGSIYLSGLRVLREYRKKGIAKSLVKAVIKEWAGKGKICARALVEPGNMPSISLMSGLGFKKVAVLHLYRGTLDVSGFTKIDACPDTYVDTGLVPERTHPGIEATFYRKGSCAVSMSNSNKWETVPSFTVINHEGCEFIEGRSFITSLEQIPEHKLGGLVPISKFEQAFLMEADLKGMATNIS